VTRARNTSKVARWSEGAIVPSFPNLRARYGDAIANEAEMLASMAAEARERPFSRDIKRTLELVRDQPAAVAMSELPELRAERTNLARRAQELNNRYPRIQPMPQAASDELDAMLARIEQVDERCAALRDMDFSRLDSDTLYELLRHHKTFCVIGFDQLSPERLSACATVALSNFQSAPEGRPGKEWLAVWLLRIVLDQLGDVPASERNKAVSAALQETKFASHKPRTVRRLVAEAKEATSKAASAATAGDLQAVVAAMARPSATE
jgi:hypothetical protein